MASKPWSPDRHDIIWIDCSPQVGREGMNKLQDIHPLLVLSPKAFNERTGIVIGLPMTTAAYNETNPFAVKLLGADQVAGYILSHQPKSFDWRARGAKRHPWKQAPQDVFALACETLNQIIAIGE